MVWGDSFTGWLGVGVMAGFFTLGIIVIFLLFAAFYIYSSLAIMTIAKKLKNKNAWVAWIPIANVGLVLQMGGFHWAWVFLLLVPFLGWLALAVLAIISLWRIFEKVKYPGWFSLSLIIPQIGGILYMIAIGFGAWGKGMKR